MLAYIKNGVLDSYSEELFQKHVPATVENVVADDGSGTVIGEIVIPEVPWLVYDEAIEYDFEEIPVLEDGAIVPYSESRKKIEDDRRKADAEAERVATRKAEIRAQIGLLAKQRDGLIELDEPAESVQAEIDALKDEYASLTA